MGADSLRCFIAVGLPADIREGVGGFTETLASRVRGVKWVVPDKLHLTLKFLGPVERPRVPELAQALEEAAARRPPFRVCFRGAGVFPKPERPRVVWIGISEGGPELAALQEAIEARIAPLGYPRERRHFTPHLTIGRVKTVHRPGILAAALAEVEDRVWGDCVVPGVQLIRSQLFPTGPTYSILHQARLSGK